MATNTTENNKSADNNTARSMGNYGNEPLTAGIDYVADGLGKQLISSIQVLSGDITISGKQIAKGQNLKEDGKLADWNAFPVTGPAVVLPNINECVITVPTSATYIVYYG